MDWLKNDIVETKSQKKNRVVRFTNRLSIIYGYVWIDSQAIW